MGELEWDDIIKRVSVSGIHNGDFYQLVFDIVE
jgi:hypothetical protein